MIFYFLYLGILTFIGIFFHPARMRYMYTYLVTTSNVLQKWDLYKPKGGRVPLGVHNKKNSCSITFRNPKFFKVLS